MLNSENKVFIVFAAILFILLFLMQYQLWFSNGGLPQSYIIKDKIEEQLLINKSKLQENNALFQKIQAFRSSHVGVVGQARYDLGMIKKGEDYFQFN